MNPISTPNVTDFVNSPKCPICGARGLATNPAWRHRCTICEFEYSTFQPHIEDAATVSMIDESRRRFSLENLRKSNASRTLDALERIRALKGCTLLDIGCSYGWFLDSAQARGISSKGIEPEAGVAQQAIANGHRVVVGFFPTALTDDESFDIICFNDALEHISDPATILDSCYAHLPIGGLLSITIPIRSGFFYRAACVFSSVGIGAPMDRMWQTAFHSPHISYFSQQNLELLAQRVGFEPVAATHLPSLTAKGLWSRLRYDRTSSIATAIAQYIALLPITFFL